MIKGLEILNNRIQQEKIIPKQLQQVIIRIRNCSKLETEEKNTIWAEKDKIFDNKNRERETGTNRTTGKGRKDWWSRYI